MRQQLQGRFCGAHEQIAGFVPIPPGIGYDMHITVDGDGLRNVVAVDTWAGWVDAFALDDKGSPVAISGKLQTRRYYGRVTAVLKNAGYDDIDHLTRAELVLG